MTDSEIKTALDDYINREKSSPESIAFVESLRKGANISAGYAVYALAFYSGVKAQEESNNGR